jgi:hypothetical protein
MQFQRLLAKGAIVVPSVHEHAQNLFPGCIGQVIDRRGSGTHRLDAGNGPGAIANRIGQEQPGAKPGVTHGGDLRDSTAEIMAGQYRSADTEMA